MPRVCSAVADKRAWLLARGRRLSPRHAHAGDWCVLDTVGGLRRRPVLATDWQAQDHLGRGPGGRVQAAGGPLLLLLGRPEVRQLLGLLRVLRRAAVRQRPGHCDAAAAQPADAARVHHRSGAARAVPSRHGHGQPGGGDGCRSLHGGGEPLSVYHRSRKRLCDRLPFASVVLFAGGVEVQGRPSGGKWRQHQVDPCRPTGLAKYVRVRCCSC
mmetsp:Transcript_58216/g.139714  ORF Transcript_58216/g.139714 Transcript_58216/m.139714 type:complete len:213 (+) Transcript_58216:812-1450(+)